MVFCPKGHQAVYTISFSQQYFCYVLAQEPTSISKIFMFSHPFDLSILLKNKSYLNKTGQPEDWSFKTNLLLMQMCTWRPSQPAAIFFLSVQLSEEWTYLGEMRFVESGVDRLRNSPAARHFRDFQMFVYSAFLKQIGSIFVWHSLDLTCLNRFSLQVILTFFLNVFA